MNEPGPSEETGPGTHYRSTFANPSSSRLSSISTPHKKHPSVTSREINHSAPHASASAGQNIPGSSHHGGSRDDNYVTPKSTGRPSTEIPTSNTGGRTRATSLSSRYIGDDSHRPLDIIRKETRAANRAPHLRKKHLVGPDTIDSLDTTGGVHHHAGPYDATYLARNTSFLNSPVEAVSGTNEETLKATPREKVLDSVTKHRPLDGVAVVPSGMTDRSGNTLQYEEGSDLMVEAGYKRWPGVVKPSTSMLTTNVMLTVSRNISPRTSKAKASLRIPSKSPSRNTSNSTEGVSRRDKMLLR